MPTEPHDTDANLWQQETAQAEGITAKKRVLPAPPALQMLRRQVRSRIKDSTEARHAATGIHGYAEVCLMDSRLKRRVSKGKERIEATLDLHGLTVMQAHDSLHHFLQTHQQYGVRTVLVITGKGVNGEGALRRSVPLWLESKIFADIVQSYEHAALHHGGHGAFYMRIRPLLM